ncbi:stage II sporulation protein M [Pelosinus sp. IPA-1]|jgi:stage II sporulation protein M|uniref:stage II sporulation protein M n=1 Tax=Pelosinus sp. IPA-1 TaxID=3029569 RepID=UPI0024361898|nr:stage II sporulation protein M [Pelosinus sp. IPA-1]GMA99203.1 stage II sporulation protein M [Pelosinus sp. IPA-1]
MLGYLRQNFGMYLKANIVAYFFMILIFVIGIVVGALAVKILPDEQKTELINYLRIFFTGLAQGTEEVASSETMIGVVMFNNAKTVVLMWILGFTIVGIPFVLFILFTRGFIIGFTVGFLVNEYVMKGLLFAFASVLPHNLFAVPAILVLSVSATTFSLMLLRRKTYGKVNIWYEAIRYSIVCMIILALMLFAALLEVYISPVFMKLAASLLAK